MAWDCYTALTSNLHFPLEELIKALEEKASYYDADYMDQQLEWEVLQLELKTGEKDAEKIIITCSSDFAELGPITLHALMKKYIKKFESISYID